MSGSGWETVGRERSEVPYASIEEPLCIPADMNGDVASAGSDEVDSDDEDSDNELMSDDGDKDSPPDVSQNLCYLQDRPQVISDDRIIEAKVRIAKDLDKKEDDEGEVDDDVVAGFDLTHLSAAEDIEEALAPLEMEPEMYFRPGIFPGVEVELRRIPDKDPRRALRGQWGLFAASKSIPRLTIIGPYAGWLRHGKDITDEWYSKSPKVRARAEAASEYTLYIGQFRVRELSGVDASGNDSQVQDGLGDMSIQASPSMGNETMYINDARGLMDESKRRNCTFVQIIHDGWPYVFVVATQDIAPNDELLLSYGDDFWDKKSSKRSRRGYERLCGFVLLMIAVPLILIPTVLFTAHRLAPVFVQANLPAFSRKALRKALGKRSNEEQ